MDNNFIYEKRNVFDDNFCDTLINIIDCEFDKNIFDQVYNTYLREDFCWDLYNLNKKLNSDVENILYDYFLEYMNLFSILKCPGTNLMYAYTKLQKTLPGGGFHQWHFEDFDISLCNRELVWMIYLNDNYDGGETEFLYQKLRIIPEKGKLLIWPADFTHTHRGNMVMGSNSKYVCTGWIERF